ncbi:MAG: zinc ribbon domain-containing protein [Dehalococcoidia bacterium]|nr:MAG: zinc ribbon domain-containing protein [Dehalococcoidia bacterium]
MTVAVALILAALAFVIMAYPLFRQRPSPTDSVEDERLLELHAKRDAVYSAIKELEFDFKSGSLSAKDYHDLEASYKRKAISSLKDIDDWEKGSTVEDEIERQVMAMRQTKKDVADSEKGGKVEDEIEREVMRLRHAAGEPAAGVCPECGAEYPKEWRFCPQCGRKL